MRVRVWMRRRQRLPLEALAAPQEAAVVEHVGRLRVERPVVAFARVARLAGDLDEAVVEREVVADAVLPGGVKIFSLRNSIYSLMNPWQHGRPQRKWLQLTNFLKYKLSLYTSIVHISNK